MEDKNCLVTRSKCWLQLGNAENALADSETALLLLYFQLFVEGLMSYYIICICLVTDSGVQNILCCVFVLFFFILYSMLLVSLDCPILIAPSVFSNV
jgi:hypothetical protein